jgi:hypothetical protein
VTEITCSKKASLADDTDSVHVEVNTRTVPFCVVTSLLASPFGTQDAGTICRLGSGACFPCAPSLRRPNTGTGVFLRRLAVQIALAREWLPNTVSDTCYLSENMVSVRISYVIELELN